MDFDPRSFDESRDRDIDGRELNQGSRGGLSNPRERERLEPRDVFREVIADSQTVALRPNSNGIAVAFVALKEPLGLSRELRGRRDYLDPLSGTVRGVALRLQRYTIPLTRNDCG